MTNDVLQLQDVLLLESSNIFKIDRRNQPTWCDKSVFSELIACSEFLFKARKDFYFSKREAIVLSDAP